jgi:ferredoxin
MPNHTRQLVIAAERCIGCRACTTVCPAGLITLVDSDHRRTVRFAATCAEDCDRCAAACPTQAIRLEPAAGAAGEGTLLEFVLARCEGCGAPLAPVEMMAHVRATVPARLQVDAGGHDWLVLCPACRQEEEASRVAQEVLVTRWPG